MAPMTAAGESVAKPGPPPAGFRGVALSALLAGLCPLIPVPLVDQWALTLVRRNAVSGLLRGHGLAASTFQVRVLAGERPGRGGGCLAGVVAWAALKVLFYVLKKLLRTLVFVLMLHEAVRRTAELFTEGYLLRHAALTGGAAGALAAGEAGAWRLRAAIEAAQREVDPRPALRTVRGALAGSWGLLRRGARRLARSLRRGRRAAPAEAAVPVAEEAALLGGVLDRLTAALWLQSDYRRRLEERFAAHWSAADAVQ
jgi:hypothetical protein